MKYSLAVAWATAANAVVITETLTANQVIIEEKSPARNEPWWGETPSNGYVRAVEKFVDTVVESAEHTIDNAIYGMEKMGDTLGRELGSLLDGNDRDRDNDRNRRGDHSKRRGGRRRSGSRDDDDRTIWDMIQESTNTKRFAKLVDEYDDVKDRLKDKKSDYTLFVPTDAAFDNMPDHKKPSKEFLEEILKYHIVPGRYAAGRVMSAHTLPTALELRDLGHHHQRLRVSVGLLGLYVNFYSKVVATNINACNGFIHAVDRILVPPPRQGRLIDALPGKFSTFSLAMEKTGLGSHLHRKPQHGGTVFAPTNNAFMKLGPRMNEFLFSASGEEYLKAILKYHVVTNETLYSDAYYEHENKHRSEREHGHAEMFPGGNYHVQMLSELDDKRVAVEIRRWMGMISMTINGWVRVSVQDGISQDGVVHVVESVLMPPRRSRPDEENPDDNYENDNMTVEELKERLKHHVDNDRDGHRDNRDGHRNERDGHRNESEMDL